MPTTNPVPSQDPSDLLFNAGKLDEVLNGTGNTFTDRLGTARRTVAGMNADFDAQLADAESDLNVYRASAAASAAQALGYLNTIRTTSYGAYASDPATDPLGNPPTVGDEYFNTTANLLKRFNGTTWQASDINTANLAAPNGSSLVGYDTGTVQDVLDAVTGPNGAAVIGYTPAGTGAVATTVQSKLRETVSVKDFGAVGDGVHDDTTGIQAAIDYVESTIAVNAESWAFGKTLEVYVPDGTYIVSSLQVSSPIKIVGGSNTGSIIKSNGYDAPIIKVRGKITAGTLFESQSTTLENLCILGTESSGYEHDLVSVNQIGVKLESIVGRDQPFINIIGCTIRQCKSHGVYLETTTSAKIIGCDIILNTGDGIYLTGTYNTDIAITHNKIRRNRIGVNISPNTGAYITTGRIVNNLIESNRNGSGSAGSTTRPAVGISLLRTQNLVIAENYFERHLNDIYFASNASFNTIRDNYHDKSSEIISNYPSEVPVTRRICPIYMAGLENQGNKITRNFLYIPKKPAASTDENWGTASWGNTYPPICMESGSFSEITENLARDNSTGAPSDSIYSGGNKTYYRGVYLGSSSRETVKETADEFIRRCTFQTSFSNKNTRESETTISYDVPVELYVHPQVMSDAFRRKFNSSQRNTDGSLSTEVTAFGVNASGEMALPLGRPLAFQIAAGNYFVRQYVGTAIPTSGTYVAGDIVWNRSPSAGGFIGWVCVAGGAPGTWKTFGAISA